MWDNNSALCNIIILSALKTASITTKNENIIFVFCFNNNLIRFITNLKSLKKIKILSMNHEKKSLNIHDIMELFSNYFIGIY